MDPTEPTREELLELLASLEARTGVMIGPPQVARGYNQLAARVVDDFVDLGDGDSQTGVAAIMDSPPYASDFGIEGPPLREQVVSVDWETGFGFGSTITAITVPSLMRYDVFSDDHRCHVADWMRTRVTPGADPRAEWSGSLMATDPTIYRDEPHTPKWYEVGSADRPDLAWVESWNARGWRLFSRARYVPVDVLRWRDPEHRAAMTERAREYASHLPGMRA